LRKADQSLYNTCVVNFVKEISLILVDECHFIGDEKRGLTLEIVLNRLKMMCTARIIALSATIPNYNQICQYLNCNLNLVFGDE